MADHQLDAVQQITLLEACRAKDRLDRLASLYAEGHDSKLLPDANATANLMKQLLASMRLPDESGRRAQRRGTARGVYRPKGTA